MAKSTQALVSDELIASRILILRGQRVIIDADLAELTAYSGARDSGASCAE